MKGPIGSPNHASTMCSGSHDDGIYVVSFWSNIPRTRESFNLNPIDSKTTALLTETDRERAVESAVQTMIHEYGWNGAFVAFVSLLGLGFLPIVILFYRSEPSTCGLELEQGLPVLNQRTQNESKDAVVQKTVGEARKEPVYWVILFSMAYWRMFNTGFTFHIVSIFNEIGMDANQAVKIFLPISIVSVISRFFGSYLSDRVAIHHIYCFFVLMLIIASASVAVIASPIARIVAISAYGISSGLFGMLNIVTWPKIYGCKHIGAISGFAMSMIVAGSAIGPWLFSLSHRFTGSYRSAGIFGMICSALFLQAVLLVKFPSQKIQKQS